MGAISSLKEAKIPKILLVNSRSTLGWSKYQIPYDTMSRRLKVLQLDVADPRLNVSTLKGCWSVVERSKCVNAAPTSRRWRHACLFFVNRAKTSQHSRLAYISFSSVFRFSIFIFILSSHNSLIIFCTV